MSPPINPPLFDISINVCKQVLLADIQMLFLSVLFIDSIDFQFSSNRFLKLWTLHLAIKNSLW